MKKNVLLSLLMGMCLTGQAQVADKKSYLAAEVVEMHKQWPNNRTQNLVFHGHSVPTGYYVASTVKTFDSYPFYTLKSLKEKYNCAVLNCIITSIGGENAKRGAERFDTDVLNYKPNVLFIDYSLNDRGLSLADARTAWVKMIEKALAKDIKVILCTPTPDTNENILSADAPLKAHADQVRALAAEYKTGLVDSYAIFKQKAVNGENLSDYMAQPNHPNEKGHRLVADEILSWFTGMSVTTEDAFFPSAFNFVGATGAAALFDYDQDALSDIIYSDATTVHVYRNLGNDAYEKVTGTPFSGANSGNIRYADIDNDNRKELYITGYTKAKAIGQLFGKNARGEWEEIIGHGLPAVYSHTNTAEQENTSAVFADINKDGYRDVVVNGFNEAGVLEASVYMNNKNRTFSRLDGTPFVPANGGGVVAADLNGDGYEDLVFWGYSLANPMGGITHVYKNNGNGTFSQQGGNFTAKSWSSQVVTGDFNGDGHLDFVQLSWAPSVFLGNGDFTFTERGAMGISAYSRNSAEVLDLNDDGYDDLVVAGLVGNLAETSIYCYNAQLSLFEKKTISDHGEYSSVSMADMNGDGSKDLFVVGLDRTLTPCAKLFYNNVVTSELEPVASESPYVLYPNPAVGRFSIGGDFRSVVSVKMFDLQGVGYPVRCEGDVVDCSLLPKGNYIVQIGDSKAEYQHKISIK